MIRVDLRRLWQRFIRRKTAAVQPPVRSAPGVAGPVFRLPPDHQAAAVALVDPAVLETIGYRNRVLSVSLTDCHHEVRDFTRAFLSELNKRGMPFFVHSACRTDREQNSLFARGVTKARAGQSPHNHGMAVDIVHYGRYWDLTEKEWAVIGLIGKEVARRRNVKVTWGGDWKFFDPAHWELANWSSRVRNGEATFPKKEASI